MLRLQTCFRLILCHWHGLKCIHFIFDTLITDNFENFSNSTCNFSTTNVKIKNWSPTQIWFESCFIQFYTALGSDAFPYCTSCSQFNKTVHQHLFFANLFPPLHVRLLSKFTTFYNLNQIDSKPPVMPLWPCYKHKDRKLKSQLLLQKIVSHGQVLLLLTIGKTFFEIMYYLIRR